MGTVTLAALCSSNCNASALPAKFNGADGVNGFLLAYHFFGLLWTNQFLQGIVMVTVAGAVSEYYFSKARAQSGLMARRASGGARNVRAQDKDALNKPTWHALKRVFRFYLGSIAFGSLIIAIVQVAWRALSRALATVATILPCSSSARFWPTLTSKRRACRYRSEWAACGAALLLALCARTGVEPASKDRHEGRAVLLVVLREDREVHHALRVHRARDEGARARRVARESASEGSRVGGVRRASRSAPRRAWRWG